MPPWINLLESRCPRCPVSLLDQRHGKAAAGCVEGGTRSGDAPPNDRDVEDLAFHPVERVGTLSGAELGAEHRRFLAGAAPIHTLVNAVENRLE